MIYKHNEKPDPGTVTILGFNLRKSPLYGSQELQFVASGQVFATILAKLPGLIGGAFISRLEKFAYSADDLIVMTKDDFEKMVEAIDNGSSLQVKKVGSYFIRSQKKEKGKLSPGGKVTFCDD